MFLDNSRYAKQKTMAVKTASGRRVTALTLRRLSTTGGNAYSVQSHDRLDLLADLQFNQPTQFWRIADANTELEANALVNETGRVMVLPK